MMDIHTATETAFKNGYAQGKADAAREIFAGIESLCELYQYISERTYDPELKNAIAELKKKYTEGQT